MIYNSTLQINMHSKSLQLCLTFCNPMDCSLPRSSVHRIFQAITLEWVAMPSSRGSFWPKDQTCVSYVSCIGKQGKLLAWLISPPLDSPFPPPCHLYLLPPPSLLYQIPWISVCSGWWRTLRELITGWIRLAPFDSRLYPPGHLCLLPPSSFLCITPWTSLSGPNFGAHIRKWLLASLLSPLLIPPHLIWVTSNSLLPLLFSM